MGGPNSLRAPPAYAALIPCIRCAQPPMCCKPRHEDVIDAIAGQLRGGPGGGRRQDCPVLVALFSNERRSSMTRLLAGILLIVLPTVMIGGVSARGAALR